MPMDAAAEREQLIAAAPQHAAWNRVDIGDHDLLDMLDADIRLQDHDADTVSILSSY